MTDRLLSARVLFSWIVFLVPAPECVRGNSEMTPEETNEITGILKPDSFRNGKYTGVRVFQKTLRLIQTQTKNMMIGRISEKFFPVAIEGSFRKPQFFCKTCQVDLIPVVFLKIRGRLKNFFSARNIFFMRFTALLEQFFQKLKGENIDSFCSISFVL